MLAAQQEQMRICGDIHGVDLNIAFQNSTILVSHYLGVSTIPFYTKYRTKGQYFDMLELFNIGGEIPVPWTVKLPMYSLTMFPKKRGEVYGTRHEGEELHFHGRFCGSRSAISKSWGIHLIFGKITGKLIPGFDEIRIQQCRNFWAFDALEASISGVYLSLTELCHFFTHVKKYWNALIILELSLRSHFCVAIMSLGRSHRCHTRWKIGRCICK